MISTQELYEAGYVSSEHNKEIHYVEFSKKIGNWWIDVTNEIEGDMVSKLRLD